LLVLYNKQHKNPAQLNPTKQSCYTRQCTAYKSSLLRLTVLTRLVDLIAQQILTTE